MINVVIDISHHQGKNIDFIKVKQAGVWGCIHKATQYSLDPLYASNRKKALDAGLQWGAYHFGVGDKSAANQLDDFLEKATPDKHTLLALDYEPNVSGAHRLGPDMSAEQAVELANLCDSQLGRFPMLYTGMAMQGHFPNLPQCPLWWARYANQPKGIPPIWPTWTLWQYTDGAHGPTPRTVNGIGPCDRDQFNGDFTSLQTLWGLGA